MWWLIWSLSPMLPSWKHHRPPIRFSLFFISLVNPRFWNSESICCSEESPTCGCAFMNKDVLPHADLPLYALPLAGSSYLSWAKLSSWKLSYWKITPTTSCIFAKGEISRPLVHDEKSLIRSMSDGFNNLVATKNLSQNTSLKSNSLLPQQARWVIATVVY